MKRKRHFAAILGMVLTAGVFLAGCDTPTSQETQYYYYEFFRVSRTHYNSISRLSTVTFDSIKDYKDKFKSQIVEHLGEGTDITQDSIYEFLTSRDAKPAQANEAISLINTVGNNVIFFEYKNDSDYIVVGYFERL